ncbi:hypothetical protein BJY04DRAFT_188422 [Aspergillus karnatakaensis]|uniref:amidohydrolase family protein n=1 Tax=Aspergillus karnatakaensis TaxID=1810916 RepID=UPI003CCD36FA
MAAIENNPKLAQGLHPPQWDPSKTLDFMARNNITTSILSCPMPVTAIHQDAIKTATLAREVNEYLASLCAEYPGKFGFFAALPSPGDTDTCIKEIRYALTTLKADGVSLFTSYDDKYLGHPDFEAVWRELNSHAAVVFTHPTMEDVDKSIKEPFTIPRPLLDWSHETTRTAVHLILTNTLREVASDCRIILSHGGGTLPFVAGRIADLGIQAHISGKSPEEFLNEARMFYFDLALMGHSMAAKMVLEFAREGHVLYGTDYPFVKGDAVEREWGIIGGEGLMSATRGAAEGLFSRLKG